jgi:hypothetical protein
MANPIGFVDEPELIDLPGITSRRCGSRRNVTIFFRTHSRAERFPGVSEISCWLRGCGAP